MADNTQKRDGLGIGEAGRVPASTVEDELEAERLQPTPTTNLRKCARCGRLVPREWLYGTNTHGSVCPDCYDRMGEDD